MDGWKNHGPPNPEDIASIMETVSTQLPGMIKGILDSFFSPEAASNIAKAVAEFRKNLIEGGIPEDEAMSMTREYLSTLTNWSKMMREVRGSKWGHKKEE